MKWLCFGIHCIIFGIPLQIQRKRMLGKKIVGYLQKGIVDCVGKCSKIEMRLSNNLWDAPFIYTVDRPEHLWRTLRGRLLGNRKISQPESKYSIVLVHKEFENVIRRIKGEVI